MSSVQTIKAMQDAIVLNVESDHARVAFAMAKDRLKRDVETLCDIEMASLHAEALQVEFKGMPSLVDRVLDHQLRRNDEAGMILTKHERAFVHQANLMQISDTMENPDGKQYILTCVAPRAYFPTDDNSASHDGLGVTHRSEVILSQERDVIILSILFCFI